MTEQQKKFPEFYVTAPQPCPYLPGRLERKLFTHLTHDKPPALVDNLLKGGFRRSQNIAYMPYCEGCQACVSVRVLDYAMMVEDSIIDTFVTEYRQRPQPGARVAGDKQPLLAVSLCDRLSDG